MIKSNVEILNELKELSPLLAGMEKTNVFTVPQGYFEGLSDHVLGLCKAEEPLILNDFSKQEHREVPSGYFDNLADSIMARIKAGQNETAADELRALSPALFSIQNENVFEVPAGYFEGLAETIMGKINVDTVDTNETAAEELKTLSPMLYSIQNENVFEVPAGYFDGLADTIIAKINIKTNETATEELRALSPMLYSIQNENVYEVPVGYFDRLAETIIAKVSIDTNETAAEELRALSPMLYSIQNENVFEVPKGYFAELADDILSKVKPAKVVTMRKRSYNFMKYAVAAAFTGMMALGVFKFTQTNQNSKNDPYAIGGQIAKEGKVDEELAKVSDADIVKYLESSGSDVKSALVANSVDDNELPSQDDYLLDDQALDKYLNSINVNDLKN